MTTIKERADQASVFASEKLHEASARVRESASVARERTGGAIGDNPLAALAGGLALGALVASLLPRTRQEAEYLGPIGERLRDASREQLGELGLSRDAAREKVSKLVETAIDAVRPKN